MRSRKACAIDQLDEHTAGRARMKERDVALRSRARLAIDELDALLREGRERRPKIVDDEAQVMQGWPAAFSKEASDAGRRVRRFDELDPGVRRLEEHGPYTLIGDDAVGTRDQSEDVAVEGQRSIDRGDDDGDVVQLAGVRDHPRSPGA